MSNIVLVVESSNTEINKKINEIFSKHNGIVKLKTLSQMLIERFGYEPFHLYRDDDPEVDVFKKTGHKVYAVRDEFVYVKPILLIDDTRIKYV